MGAIAMCFIRDEKGAAMIVALLVMVVLLLLGTALWQYSTSDTIHVAMDEKRMQAYYLARAGADATLQIWKESPGNSKPSGTSEPMYLDALTGEFTADQPDNVIGHFIVNVTNNNNNTTIESTGEVSGVVQKVTLNISSDFKYGHLLDPRWYRIPSGQMEDGVFEEDGVVILDAETGLGNPNKETTYIANHLFFRSPLGSPFNKILRLQAETIVFEQEVSLGINGELYLHLYSGKEEGIVYFKDVKIQNKETALSNKAYIFKATIAVHDLQDQSDIDVLIEQGKLVLINYPQVLSPEAFITVVWE